MTELKRKHGRSHNCVRPLNISYNVFGYAPGSVLFEMGNTKVLCAVSLQNNVPPFLRGKGTGWLTAEYAMLPTATQQRINRESSSFKRNGRSIEISRLIGRALRTMVNLEKLGERTIYIDCDVLQADGGTRTACITGASAALEMAVQTWLQNGNLAQDILVDRIAAVSVGVCQEGAILDLNYEEDCSINADVNVVMTKSGKLVEIQGTAEKEPISWDTFEDVKLLACQGVEQIFAFLDSQRNQGVVQKHKPVSADQEKTKPKKASLFSLGNRQAG